MINSQNPYVNSLNIDNPNIFFLYDNNSVEICQNDNYPNDIQLNSNIITSSNDINNILNSISNLKKNQENMRNIIIK